MFDHNRDFPRAYTVPGLPHRAASTLGVKWAMGQAEAFTAPISLYVPAKQNLQLIREQHPAVHALMQQGVPVSTWSDFGPGSGVVIALWPDEEHLLEADERASTRALVAVTWSPQQTLGWAQAKNANPLGGPRPDIVSTPPLDLVVAEAVNSLGIVVGQHKTADQRYKAAIAKGLTILRNAGYVFDPGALHTHAIGHGWRASNAEKLREVAARVNEGRSIQGMKSAPLRDDVLIYWRERAARGGAVAGE